MSSTVQYMYIAVTIHIQYRSEIAASLFRSMPILRVALLLTVAQCAHGAFLSSGLSLSIPKRTSARTGIQALAADEEVDVVVVGRLGWPFLRWPACSVWKEGGGTGAALEIGGCAHEFCVGLDGKTIPTRALTDKPDTPVFRLRQVHRSTVGSRPTSRRIRSSTYSR